MTVNAKVEYRQSNPRVEVRVSEGPAGNPGAPGTSVDPVDLGVVIALTPAGTSWTITHDLLFRPSVSVTDSAGNVVYCDVRHLNPTQILITTDATFSGEASLT